MTSDAVLERWIEDAGSFLEAVELRGIAALGSPAALIFEGAQGLLLDQARGAFPHVTRSNTGLRNVLALARDAGIDSVEAIYATRAYVTRHGAGPLAHELDGPPAPGVVDRTNIENPWQGKLRFGTLDVAILSRSVLDDLGDARGSDVAVSPALAVTCLDQLGTVASFRTEGRLRTGSPAALASAASAVFGVTARFESHGPTRETLVECRAGAAR